MVKAGRTHLCNDDSDMRRDSSFPAGPIARLLARLGSHELGVLLAVGCVAGGVWLFAAIADEVFEGDTLAFDRRLMLAMRKPGDLTPIGPPALQDAARDITALGGVSVLALVTMISGGFLWLNGKKHLSLFIYGSVVSGLLASLLLKVLFSAPGPILCRSLPMPPPPASPAGIRCYPR